MESKAVHDAQEKGKDAVKEKCDNPEAQTLENALKQDFDDELDMEGSEISELRADLLKSFEDADKKDENKTLSILKVLQRVRMSEPLLLETKIGKVIK